MKLMPALLPVLVVILLVVFLATPSTAPLAAPPAFAPPKANKPDEETLKTIRERMDKLQNALTLLRRRQIRDALLTDIEVFHKAAQWIVAFNEFYDKDAAQWTLETLDQGLLRASQASRGEQSWLLERGHAVVRGYRSTIDGSLQPYAVTFPRNYAEDRSKKYRVDVVLHGRDSRLTEVKFLHQHRGETDVPEDQDWVQIDIFGRGNNGYRWAGEIDVQEAVANFYQMEMLMGRSTLIDPKKSLLRGFSMGGAGTWHIGLHYPHEWSVIGPGAGFVQTHGYVSELADKLPPYQEACLHIYDAIDYAENVFNVPVVAYAGSEDRQREAARAIQKRLEPLKIDKMTLLIGKGLGHEFPREWQKKAEKEYERYATKDQDSYPPRVRFVTYTLRYNTCDWVEILALDQHYQRTLVDAEKVGEDGLKIKTSNVRALHLKLWPEATRQAVNVTIDDQKLEVAPYPSTVEAGSLHVYLQRQGKDWKSILPEILTTQAQRVPQKLHSVQGPIDDAFMSSFLCVRGDGTPWHEKTASYAEANLQRFRDEWARYMRGHLPVKDVSQLRPEDLTGRHLVLFGDPASNQVIQQVLPYLPFRWSKDKISWDGKEYSAAEHVPVMIYPSPLSTTHYIVLNSGHTFHADDFQGTNALLYPRLGDHALLQLKSGDKDPLDVEVVRAGLFDDFWRWVRP